MTDLRDPLEDLVAEVSSYVVPDAPAAWRAGARRRTRRRAGVAAAVVVTAALVAGLVSVLPRAADVSPAGESGGVGYPAHVDEPWRLGDLPEQPGSLSAVVETPAGGWLAAAPDGRVWRVLQAGLEDSYPPALSDDGRMLGLLRGPSTYVLRDLLTGDETTFDEVTAFDRKQSRRDAFAIEVESRQFWSPDGSRLLATGAKWVAGIHVHGVVLATDGSLTEVKDAPRYSVGWLDDDTLGWLDRGRLVETDVTGQVERSVRLDLDPADADALGGWSATLSPDRSLVAVVLPDATGTVVTFSTADGRVAASETVGASGSCSPAWAGDEPVAVQAPGDGPASLVTLTGQRTMVVDPAIGTPCVLTAADALAGPRHERMGDRLFHDTWLSWHWQETGIAVLAVLVLVAAALLLLRRRRVSARGRPGSG